MGKNHRRQCWLWLSCLQSPGELFPPLSFVQLCLRTCYLSSFPGIWHFMWQLRFHFWLTGVCLRQVKAMVARCTFIVHIGRHVMSNCDNTNTRLVCLACPLISIPSPSFQLLFHHLSEPLFNKGCMITILWNIPVLFVSTL